MDGEKRLETLQELASHCKHRGFIFQSSEIYGGLGSCWDYGPLGIELKRAVQDSWWKAMTYREDIDGLDASILMHPTVWKASGHVDGFSDPLVDCKKCKSRFREDHIDLKAPCPSCGAKGEFTEPRQFNLMFKTHMGPVEDEGALVYLRPETAQGIFVNFPNVQTSMRRKLPFGIAQVGKSFRNEITPGNFIFRTREFEQMEMQYFIKPGTQKEFMEVWKEIRWNWHLSLGIDPNDLQWAPHPPDKLAHYADAAVDIEYRFPMGFGEIEGIHSRTNFDLTKHQEFSGKNLQYVDQLDGNKKFIPYVIETAVGLNRCVLMTLCNAYRVENPGDAEKERVVLRLNPNLAPVKVGVMPLVKKSPIDETAQALFKDLSKTMKCEYDTAGSIGKRYRRQDEIGTPYCITVDYETANDQKVTIRERDSMKQERVSLDQVKTYLNQEFQKRTL